MRKSGVTLTLALGFSAPPGASCAGSDAARLNAHTASATGYVTRSEINLLSCMSLGYVQGYSSCASEGIREGISIRTTEVIC